MFSKSSLFDVCSIDFARLFTITERANQFWLVCDTHLTGWAIKEAIQRANSRKVLLLMSLGNISLFGLPLTVFSDNTMCYHTILLREYLNVGEMNRRTVFKYVSISKGRAKRLVGTVKKVVWCIALSFFWRVVCRSWIFHAWIRTFLFRWSPLPIWASVWHQTKNTTARFFKIPRLVLDIYAMMELNKFLGLRVCRAEICNQAQRNKLDMLLSK